jgi:putative transposase
MSTDWPHAPLHRFGGCSVYFVTAGTLRKQHYFRAPAARDYLRDSLFNHAKAHECWLQAWAIFSNHYHLVVASDLGENVKRMLRKFHVNTAIDANRHDGVKGRKVWYQFRDTQLTIEASWLARLRYTHENAVHHGLVRDATQYRWCSASWFASTARPAFVETVRRIKIDRVNVYDDYAAVEGDGE